MPEPRQYVLSASTKHDIIVARVTEGCVKKGDPRYLPDNDEHDQFPTARLVMLPARKGREGKILSRREDATRGVDLESLDTEKSFQIVMQAKALLKKREAAFLEANDTADKEWHKEYKWDGVASEANAAAAVEAVASPPNQIEQLTDPDTAPAVKLSHQALADLQENGVGTDVGPGLELHVESSSVGPLKAWVMTARATR